MGRPHRRDLRVGVAALCLVGSSLGACSRGDRQTQARAHQRASANTGRLQGAGEAKIIQLSPPEARTRAPLTGWTRAHYEALFGRLLLGHVQHRSMDGGRTRFPGAGGDELPAAMEGAVRILPALGAWLACECNPERIRVEGRELDVVGIAEALVLSGTDPESPDYWHKIRGGWDQRQVEAALVGEFLVRSRARIWDHLEAGEREQILAWLSPAEESLAGNWLGLQIARNTARASLGAEIPEQALEEQLDLLELEYVGDGFYSDGYEHRIDWYNSLVVHPELSFWRSQRGASDPARAARLAERTRAFLGHLPFLVDDRGRVAPLGRSLGYRSAVLAALSSSVLAGDDFVLPGLARRMLSGSLRFHLEAGMFDTDLSLRRGYHGEQPRVGERYIRPGSQYFFSRALGVLALPPEHAFWTEPELPVPADLGDFVHAIPAVGWELDFDRAVDRRAPGEAAGAGLILRNAGSATRKTSYYARYMQLDYGAWSWFGVPEQDTGRVPYDSKVISAGALGFDRHREPSVDHAVASGFAWQRYAMAPEDEMPAELMGEEGEEGQALGQDSEPKPVTDPGASPPHWISTATLSALPGSVDLEGLRPSLRLSCVEPNGVEPARAYEGSAAITRTLEGLILGGGGQRWAYLESGDPNMPGSGAVFMSSAHGWARAGLNLDYGTADHVLGGRAAFVGLAEDREDPGFDERRCFASWQVASERPFAPGPHLAATPKVEFDGADARVRYANGDQAFVDLGASTRERSLELAGLHVAGPVRMVWVRADAQVMVAVGLRELGDKDGPLIRADADAPLSFVACARGGEGWLCEVDGPTWLRTTGTSLMLSQSGWRGSDGLAEVSAKLTPKDGYVLVDAAAHGLGPDTRGTTTVVAVVF